MKNKFILSTLALAALVGCTRETAPQVQKATSGNAGEDLSAEVTLKKPITFSVSEGTKTVSEVTATTLQTSGFKIAALIGSDDNVVNERFSNLSLYFNTTASYSEGAYHTPLPYFFPAGEDKGILFYAINASAINYSDCECDFSVTSPYDKDIVVAKSKWTTDSGTDAVALAFSHVLSQLAIEAKGGTGNLSFDISSVSIATPNNGTYMLSDMEWGNGATAAHSYFSGTSSHTSSAYTAVGTKEAFFPGSWTATVNYSVKSGNIVLATYSKNFTATLTAGKRHTYKLTLPFDDSDEIGFSVSVTDWENQTNFVNL